MAIYFVFYSILDHSAVGATKKFPSPPVPVGVGGGEFADLVPFCHFGEHFLEKVETGFGSSYGGVDELLGQRLLLQDAEDLLPGMQRRNFRRRQGDVAVKQRVVTG